MIRLEEMDFAIKQNVDGLYIEKHQNIPTEFLDRNKELKDGSSKGYAKDYHQVASVPEVVVDQWLREGFDVYKEPARAIVAKLKAEGLDYFVTSNKRI